MKREPEFVLRPATFRERKNFFNPNPRTLEQIEAAEQAAAERKRVAEEQAAFEAEKLRLEEERKKSHEQQD